MNNYNNLEQILKDLHHLPAATPEASFRTNARIRLLNLLSTPSAASVPLIRARAFRWAGAFAVATLILGTGAVYASQSSLPGTPLYPVKIASEKVALNLAPTGQIKTSVATGMIDRRADEVNKLHQEGATEETKVAVKNYTQTVAEIKNTAQIDLDEVEQHLTKHQDLMSEVEKEEKQSAPEKEDSDLERLTPTPKTTPSEVKGVTTQVPPLTPSPTWEDNYESEIKKIEIIPTATITPKDSDEHQTED